MIKIDHGIKLPETKRVHTGAQRKYPWKEMDIGDSFAVNKDPKLMRTQASRAGNVYGGKFVVRMFHKKTRVWRVK